MTKAEYLKVYLNWLDWLDANPDAPFEERALRLSQMEQATEEFRREQEMGRCDTGNSRSGCGAHVLQAGRD